MKKTLLVLVAALLVFCCTSFAVLASDEVTDATADFNAKINEFYDVENLEITSISIVADEESYVILNGKFVSEGKEASPWSAKFDISEEQYIELFHINDSVLVYEKSEESIIDSKTAELVLKAVNDSKVNLDVDIEFKPNEFTRNIKYMGLGMLGIFVVVGIVIILTFALNKATTKKQ